MLSVNAQGSTPTCDPVPERSLQRYTAEEDQRILDEWWQPQLRPALLQELGRSKAAIAQRYYFLLRALRMSPEEFRRAKQQGRVVRAPNLQPSSPEEATSSPRRVPGASSAASALDGSSAVEVVEPWTPERDAFLQRQVRAGTPFEEIADVLGGVTPAACRRRYQELTTTPAAGSRADAGWTAASSVAPTPSPAADDSQDGTDVLAALRQLPAEQRQLRQQLVDLQSRVNQLADLQSQVNELAQRVAALSARVDATASTGASMTLGGPAGLPPRSPEIEELVATIRTYLQLDPWEKVGRLSQFLTQLEQGVCRLQASSR